MTNYMELSKKCNEFIVMTWLSVDEFDSLLFYFKKAERKRKHAIYKNSPIKCPTDRLLFILTYMKQHMTQTAIGNLFGISQPEDDMFMHHLTSLLSEALRESGSSPCGEIKNLNEYDVYCHEGTERHINRPKDSGRQKEHYSGKKRLALSKTT